MSLLDRIAQLNQQLADAREQAALAKIKSDARAAIARNEGNAHE